MCTFFFITRDEFLVTMGDDEPRGLALVRPPPGENSSDSAPQLPQHNSTIQGGHSLPRRYHLAVLSAHAILPISIDIGRPTDGVYW
jgi:hypothetical protein